VRLEVGQKLAVDVILKVGPVSEGVKVTGASEVLHTKDASVGGSGTTKDRGLLRVSLIWLPVEF
jgi:hypothetical protein